MLLFQFLLHYHFWYRQKCSESFHMHVATMTCSNISLYGSILTTCYFSIGVLSEVCIQHSITDLVTDLICGAIHEYFSEILSTHKKNDIMVIAFSPISLTVVFSRLHSSSVPSILFPLFLLQYKTWPSSPVDFSKQLNDLQSRSFKSHISFCFRPMTSFPRT